MTPEEILHNLKNLPEDSVLTPAHIIGIVEIIKPLLKQNKPKDELDFDKLSDYQLIDEKTLSKWIGQSVHTIRKWREKGGVGPKITKASGGSVRYKVKHVKEWIDSNVYTSTTDYDYRNKKFEGMNFTPAIPSFIHKNEVLTLFESIEREEEPDEIVFTQYEIGSVPALVIEGKSIDEIEPSSLRTDVRLLINGKLKEVPLNSLLTTLPLKQSDLALLFEMGLEVQEDSPYHSLAMSVSTKNKLYRELPEQQRANRTNKI